MARRDQHRLREQARQLEEAHELQPYTAEVEESINRHVERLNDLSGSDKGTARLVADTLTRTLGAIPDKQRINFVYAVVAGVVAIVFLYLKYHH